MIARTAIDSDALLDHQDDPRRKLNVHRDVLKAIADYGVVQLLGPQDAVSLFDAIRELSPDLRVLWTAVIKNLDAYGRVRRGDAGDTVRDVCRLPQLPEGLNSVLDLMVVGERSAGDLELPTVGYARRDPRRGPEFAVAQSIRHCATVESLEAQAKYPNYAKGTDRELVWNERFAPLARIATEVTVLDQFLFKRFTGAGSKGIEHVDWLLKRLNESLPAGVGVTILASDIPKEVTDGLATWLEKSSFHTSRPGSLQVCLAPWKKVPPRWRPGVEVHNRHIRFGAWAALGLTEGFDRLSRAKIWGHDGLTVTRVFAATLPGEAGMTEFPSLIERETVAKELQVWRWPRPPA